jgi:hypothetical protein
MFLQPTNHETLPDFGTVLSATVFPGGFGQGMEVKTIVKWSGHSNGHRCDGLGLEFKDVGDAALLFRKATSTAA